MRITSFIAVSIAALLGLGSVNAQVRGTPPKRVALVLPAPLAQPEPRLRGAYLRALQRQGLVMGDLAVRVFAAPGDLAGAQNTAREILAWRPVVIGIAGKQAISAVLEGARGVPPVVVAEGEGAEETRTRLATQVADVIKGGPKAKPQ